MTLQEAYKQAIELPIKDLPNIEIVSGTTKLFIINKVDKLCLCGSDSMDLESNIFCITTEELLSNNWEVRVI